MLLPKCDTERIPEYLKKNARFCVWRYTPEGRKPPITPGAGTMAKVNKPETFTDFGTAVEKSTGYDGLGLRVSGDLIAVDIDHCVDHNGVLSPMAADILQTLDTYAEISPSGEGLRLFLLAPGFEYDKDAFYIKHPINGLEVYGEGYTKRYVTVTGDALSDKPIADRGGQLSGVLERYMKRENAAAPPSPPVCIPAPGVSLDDLSVIGTALKAKNGEKFQRLWDGSAAQEAGADHSRLDLSLCVMLAFYTGGDLLQMDRLFRMSGLMRDKWERDDYRENTLRKAVEGCNGQFYSPESLTVARKDAGGMFIPPDEKASQNGSMWQESPIAIPCGLSEYDETGGFAADLEKIGNPIPTGFPILDEELGGGLYPGLHVIGGGSGVGKTEFVGQLADQAAAAGYDTLFFSLEMARAELYSRSLCRFTAAAFPEHSTPNAREIRMGTNNILVERGRKDYRETVGNRVRVLEGNFETSASRVIATAEKFIQETGRIPLVIVDYLQILSDEKDTRRSTVREAVDNSIITLKRGSRDLGLPVVVISAFNRKNALNVASYDSFRESSTIEYSSDTLIAMQFLALRHETFDKDEGKSVNAKRDIVELSKNEYTRKIDLSILKNRNGRSSGTIVYHYTPAKSTFAEKNMYTIKRADQTAWANVRTMIKAYENGAPVEDINAFAGADIGAVDFSGIKPV